MINFKTVECFLSSTYGGSDKVRFQNLDGSPFCGDTTVKEVRRGMRRSLQNAPLNIFALTLGGSSLLVGMLATADGPILIMKPDPISARHIETN